LALRRRELAFGWGVEIRGRVTSLLVFDVFKLVQVGARGPRLSPVLLFPSLGIDVFASLVVPLSLFVIGGPSVSP
jgi:hypothetical protein